MSWHLLTVSFGDNKFRRGQTFLHKLCGKFGLNHFAVGEDSLFNSKLYKENKKWFTKKNNRGHFAWKPYFILEAMKKLPDGEKLMVLDTMDIFHPDIFKMVDSIMDDEDPCLLPIGNSIQGDYTKRDCFVYMDCDEEDYWTSNQLEAGFTFWRVCDKSKEICEEWLKWCLDERTNGEVTGFSNKKELDGFQEVRHDQSILTNLALRDGLPVVGPEIRNLIECNADYWYERHLKGTVSIYRPIDQFLQQIHEEVDYMKPEPTDSIILTVHNQGGMIDRIIKGIEDNTEGDYELIVILDGCTDNSQEVVVDYLKNSEIENKSIINTDNIFENRANNVGLKLAQGKYAIIVQDDQLIKEKGWNTRMHKPFEAFDDVFAVTARTAHNLILNPNSRHLGEKKDRDDCWCDILDNVDIAEQRTMSRDVFAVRGSANRGPLMVNMDDMRKLNYFDEEYAPQQLDDHDLMFRMRKKLKKVCGCYWIDFESDPSWGASRKETTGFSEANPVNAKSHHKNSKLFHKRYKKYYDEYRIIEDRELPE